MEKTDLKIKAKELVEKFMPYAKNWDCYHDEPLEENNAKQCALLCVDQLIIQNGELYLKGIANDYYAQQNAYLFELKKEIELL